MARHCGRRGDQAISCKNHRSTVEFSSSRGHSSVPIRIDRAGCECVSHALQAICELDENATVTSIDGVSAFDTISRRVMLLGLERVLGGGAASPFVRLFCSEPSASGKMMVEWFTQSFKGKAESREKRFNGGCVRVNDFSRTSMTCVWCHSRTGHGTHKQELWTNAKIRIHAGKTHMWNRSGRMPEGCGELQRRAVLHDLTAQVWSSPHEGAGD